jgi:phytoene/squalene synthetase
MREIAVHCAGHFVTPKNVFNGAKKAQEQRQLAQQWWEDALLYGTNCAAGREALANARRCIKECSNIEKAIRAYANAIIQQNLRDDCEDVPF